MVGTIKTKPVDISSKAKALLAQLKDGKQIEDAKRELAERYYATKPEGSDYASILKKLGLLDNNNCNLLIPFSEAQNAYPETFCLQPEEDALKKTFMFETNDTIFYNLVVGTNGKTILEVFRNNEKVDERYNYNDYASLLNLPYLLGKILKDKKAKQVRRNLEKFLRANATSTLANLYTFAKKNFEAVNKIPEVFAVFKQKLEENGRARAEVYRHAIFIPNAFYAKIRNYGTKTKTIKYLLEEEASGPVARTDIDYQNYYYRYSDHQLIELPAKILIKEEALVPLYLPAGFFKDKGTKPSEESLSLLTFEEKLKDELAAYVATGKSDIKAAETNFRKEREEEFKSIGRALKKFLKNEASAETNRLQKEKLELLKLSEEGLQKSTDSLANLLAQLYKKEIVLNNL